MIRVQSSRSSARGFTLIELMVVVAIVAILAAIAYPSFQDAIRKSKRGQAKADLVELAQRFERYHTVNSTYDGFWTTANVPSTDRVSPRGSATGAAAYALGVEGVSRNAFLLTATPVDGSPQAKDVRCMKLTLNQAGVKTKSGTGSLEECW